MNYQDYMNEMQALAAKYNLTIDELKELIDMGYTEEDLARMSVESSDSNSQEYASGGYVLPKHQTNPNVVKNFDLSAQGYAAQNQFENSVGTYGPDGKPIGMGMGNNYAQTADKEKIEKFISDQFGSTWDQMPDNLKTQIRDMAFNYGVDTPEKQKNILAGLAQAIGHNTPGSNVPDGIDYRKNLSLQDAKNIIGGVQDWSDENLYNNYINVRGNQMGSIAGDPANNIPKAYQATMATRPQAINNMYYGGTSGYGFPNSIQNQNQTQSQTQNDGKLSFGKIGTGQNMGVVNDAISKAGTNLLKSNPGLGKGLNIAKSVIKGGINTLAGLSKYDAAAQTQRQNAQAQQQTPFRTDNGVEKRKFDFQGQNDPMFALAAELGAKVVNTEERRTNKNFANNGVAIEAEGGEFYLDPADGATIPIKGPSHDEGGVKFVAEEGSYIISDHIKIPGEILNSIIGKPVMKEKESITFAEAIRKFPKFFDTKNDVENLNNKKLDPIAQNTFRVNLKNKLENLSKLIAYQQEQNNNHGEEGSEEQETPQAQVGMQVPGQGYTLRGVDIIVNKKGEPVYAPGSTMIPLNLSQYYNPMSGRPTVAGLSGYERPSQSQAEMELYSRLENANRNQELRQFGISNDERALNQYNNLLSSGYGHSQAMQAILDSRRGQLNPTITPAEQFGQMSALDKGLFMLNNVGPMAAPVMAAGKMPAFKSVKQGTIFDGANRIKPVYNAKKNITGFRVMYDRGEVKKFTPAEIQYHLGIPAKSLHNMKDPVKTGDYSQMVQFAFESMMGEKNVSNINDSGKYPITNPANTKYRNEKGQTYTAPVYEENFGPRIKYPENPEYEVTIDWNRPIMPPKSVYINQPSKKGFGVLQYASPWNIKNPLRSRKFEGRYSDYDESGNPVERMSGPDDQLIPTVYGGPPSRTASTLYNVRQNFDPTRRQSLAGAMGAVGNIAGVVATLVPLIKSSLSDDNKATFQTDPNVSSFLTDEDRQTLTKFQDYLNTFGGDSAALERYLSTDTSEDSKKIKTLYDKIRTVSGNKTDVYNQIPTRQDGGKNESEEEVKSNVINQLILNPESYADELAALMVQQQEEASRKNRPVYNPQTYPDFIQNYILPIMSIDNVPSVDDVAKYSLYDPTQQQLPSQYMSGGYILPKHQTNPQVGTQPATPQYKTKYEDIERYFTNTDQGKKIMAEAYRRHKLKYPNSKAGLEEFTNTFLRAQKYNIGARDYANPDDPNITEEERKRRQLEISRPEWDYGVVKDVKERRKKNPNAQPDYKNRAVGTDIRNREYYDHDFAGNNDHLTQNEIIRFQETYRRLAEMKAEGFDGLEKFELTPVGKPDQIYLDQAISGTEGIYGNTTNQMLTRFIEDPGTKKICGCLGDEPFSREHTEEESKLPNFKALACGTPCGGTVETKYSCKCVNEKPTGQADPNGKYNTAEEAAKEPNCCPSGTPPEDKCACEIDPTTKEYVKNAVVTKYKEDDPKWKTGALVIQNCNILGQKCETGSSYRESLPMSMNLLTLPEPRTLNYREQYNFPRYEPQLVSYRSAKNDAASLQAQARAAGMPGQFSKLIDAYGKITEQENNTNAQIINQARQINTDIGVREQLAQQPANTRFIDANNADLAAIYGDMYNKQKDLVTAGMGVDAYNKGLQFYQNLVGGFRVGSDGKIYTTNPTTYGGASGTFPQMQEQTKVEKQGSANTGTKPNTPGTTPGVVQKKGGKNTKKKKQFTKRKYF